MKKVTVYSGVLALAIFLMGAFVSPVLAATDAKSTAELRIIDDGTKEPPLPPTDIPSGDPVINPEGGTKTPNGPFDTLNQQKNTASIVGSVTQGVKKLFPKTGEALNWWLVVIGGEVVLLAILLYFNGRQTEVLKGGQEHA